MARLRDRTKQSLLLKDVVSLRTKLAQPYEDSMSPKLKAALEAVPFSAGSFLASLGLQHFVDA